MSVTTSTRYAEIADLHRFGAPASAFTGVSDDDKNAQLEASSRKVDSALERFSPPLVTWGTDVARATCVDAAYELLVAKGLNHPAYEPKELRERYEDTIAGRPGQLSWLHRIAKGEFTPFGVIDQTPGESEMGADGWNDAPAGLVQTGSI